MVVIVRKETLIVRALVKFENRVDILRSGKIVEGHLIWANTYDGAVDLK